MIELKKRFCKQGHDCRETGVYVGKDGRQKCKVCSVKWSKNWYKRTYVYAVPATHCKRGHEFTPDNTVALPDGRRNCRICRNAKARRWYWQSTKAKQNGKMYMRKKKAELLPESLRSCQMLLFELSAIIRQKTADKYDGDPSFDRGKNICVRGHPLLGPGANMRIRDGKQTECLHCHNLLRRKENPQIKNWTDDDIAILRRRYPHEKTLLVAHELNRTVMACNRIASLRGIRKTDAFMSGPDSTRYQEESSK